MRVLAPFILRFSCYQEATFSGVSWQCIFLHPTVELAPPFNDNDNIIVILVIVIIIFLFCCCYSYSNF